MLAIAANGMAIPKPIEEIQVGDRVLSYNEETGQNQVKTVSQTFTSPHEKVVNVRQSNGQIITSSYGHPYYTKRGWIAAENLKAGDILQTVNGETVIVEFVEHVLLESSVTLYNFEVDGNHNYYVADSAKADTSEFVLVHNKGCGKSSQNQMQHQVERNQAPKGIDRVDPPHQNGQQPHIHFSEKYKALNLDGTWHDAGKKTPELTKSIKDWITGNGWKLPK